MNAIRLSKALAWLMAIAMTLSMLPAATLAVEATETEAAAAVVGEVYFIPGTVESAGSIVDAYVIASATKTPGEKVRLQVPNDIESNTAGGDSLDYATGRFWEYMDTGFTSIRNLTVTVANGNNGKQKFGYHNAIRSVDTETGLVIMQDGKQHRGSKSDSSSYACVLGFNEPCGAQKTAKPANMYGNELGPYVTFVQQATEDLPATFILDLRDGVADKIDTLEELATLATNADTTGGAAGQPVINAYAADGSYTSSTNYKTIAGHLTAVIIVDTELPPDSAAILAARRDAAEAYMRRMGTVRWRVEEDILYTISSNIRPEDDTNNATRLHLKAGRIYQGLPYTYAGGTDTSFLEYATKEENGVYTIEGITWETISGSGPSYSRLGNDCSSSVTRAWSSIGADITMTDTKSMTLNNGYLRVGEYVSSNSDNTNSANICADNGEQTMFAAYAQLQKADGLVYRGASAGHAMMVVSNHPVYNADGTIDGAASKVTILDQTRTHFRAEKSFYDEDLKETVYPIYGIDTEMTYNYMYKQGQLPITCNALIDPVPIADPAVTDSKAGSTFDKDSMLTGTISCNWMIDTLTMTITDANGAVVQEGAIRSARGKNYKVEVGRFLTDKPASMRGDIDPDALTPGNYHCKLVCRLSSGQELTARDLDFTIAAASTETFAITIEAAANGTVTVNPTYGQVGTEVTVTATPADGYVLDQILVDGTAITGTTFTITGNHTVTATFAEEGSDTEEPETPVEPEEPEPVDPTVPVDPAAGDVFFIPGQVTSGGIRREGYVIASNTLPLGQKVIINIPDNADPGNYSWDKAGDTKTFTTGRFWEVIDGTLTVIGNATLSTGTRPNKYGYHDHFSSIDTATGAIRLIDAIQHRASANDSAAAKACGIGFEESCGGSTYTSARGAYEVGPYLTFAAGTSFILDLRAAVLAGEEAAITTLDGLNVITFTNGYSSGNTTAPVVNTYAADAIYTPKTTKAADAADGIGYNTNAGTVNAFVIVDGVVTYNVTAKQAENGTVSVDKAYGAAGTTVTVTATPAEGYELEAIYVDGVAIEGTTFKITGEHTVTATFKMAEITKYAVTVGTVENGTVTVDKTEAEAGETVTITATPAEGYALQEIFVDGTAIQGETFTVTGAHTVTAQFVKIAEYAGANVTMGNELNMNFAMAKSKLAGLTGLYVKMVGPGGEKVVQQADWASSGASYYLFTYDGIAAKQMGDEITVTVYNARGNAVSVTKVDSMRAYVARSLDGATEATLKPLYVDMLNYGAAAQVNFGYKTDDLVNSWMTPEQQALATAEMKPIADQRVKGLNYKGTSLTLESRISMQLAFSNVKDKNLYAMVKFTNHSGNPVEERIDEVSVNGSYRTVRVEQIVVADGRKLVTVELYDADTNELVGSAVDSMESYIARSATGTYEWMKKIMIFSDSAYAYLHRNDAN